MSKDEFVKAIQAAQAKKKKEAEQEYQNYYYEAVNRMKRVRKS